MTPEASELFEILKDSFKEREREIEAIPEPAVVVVVDGAPLRTHEGKVGMFGAGLYYTSMSAALDMAIEARKVFKSVNYPQVMQREEALRYFKGEHKRLINAVEQANGLPLTE